MEVFNKSTWKLTPAMRTKVYKYWLTNRTKLSEVADHFKISEAMVSNIISRKLRRKSTISAMVALMLIPLASCEKYYSVDPDEAKTAIAVTWLRSIGLSPVSIDLQKPGVCLAFRHGLSFGAINDKRQRIQGCMCFNVHSNPYIILKDTVITPTYKDL